MAKKNTIWIILGVVLLLSMAKGCEVSDDGDGNDIVCCCSKLPQQRWVLK